MGSSSYSIDSTWRTLLKDIGVVPSQVFRRAGLAGDLLERGESRLACEAYYRLWGRIEEEAGHPYFPILLCEVIQGESFSPLLFGALCSSSLLEALKRVAQYKALMGPMRLDVEEDRDVVNVEVIWLDDPQSPPTTMVLAELLFYVTLGRMGTREHLRPLRVTTKTLPSPLTPYEAFLGAKLRRAGKHTLVFSHSDATRPFLTSNETIWSAFEPDLKRRLADLVEPVTVGSRVHAALLEGLPSGAISMEKIARKLVMSKRTLQRRLATEGTSFQRIVRETRVRLAKNYLENTRLSTSEIAFLLAFADPGSFHRAFRAWSGTTPDRVRQRSIMSL